MENQSQFLPNAFKAESVDLIVMCIHGWGSIGSQEKYADLHKAIGEEATLIANTYEHTDPLLALDQMTCDINALGADPRNDYKELVFVGSSTGGWWANYLARKVGGYAVLINPLADVNLLEKHVGENTNFYTNETTFFSKDSMAVYRAMDAYCRRGSYFHRIPTSLIVCSDDGILDHKIALNNMDYGSGICRGADSVVITEGGHRWFKPEVVANEIFKLINIVALGEHPDE